MTTRSDLIEGMRRGIAIQREKSRDLLTEILDTLNNMTTDEFSHGADNVICMKIAKFLDGEL